MIALFGLESVSASRPGTNMSGITSCLWAEYVVMLMQAYADKLDVLRAKAESRRMTASSTSRRSRTGQIKDGR